MAITDLKSYGLPCSDSASAFYVADSGLVAFTTSPQTVTATIPALFDGTQPFVQLGWLMLEFSGLSVTTMGKIDVVVDDGTDTVKVWSSAAAATLVAGQGQNRLLPIMITLSDAVNTIKNINVIFAFASGAPTGSCRVYFNGTN